MTQFDPRKAAPPATPVQIGELVGLRFLIVGAGFYGAVMAERIAAVLGEKVLVIDVRNHAGGNRFPIPTREPTSRSMPTAPISSTLPANPS